MDEAGRTFGTDDKLSNGFVYETGREEITCVT
jgi:hypothetical protein